jgi:hypothetical protein
VSPDVRGDVGGGVETVEPGVAEPGKKKSPQLPNCSTIQEGKRQEKYLSTVQNRATPNSNIEMQQVDRSYSSVQNLSLFFSAGKS